MHRAQLPNGLCAIGAAHDHLTDEHCIDAGLRGGTDFMREPITAFSDNNDIVGNAATQAMSRFQVDAECV
jgi:hypothetical protein